jgi:hypothetical protein
VSPALAAGGTPLLWIAVMGAALVALLLLRRWLASHPLGIPPMAVADDDPLLVEALARARETLPAFLALLPEHPGRAFVRLGDGTEHPWAQVERLDGDHLVVRVEDGAARPVDLSAVEDWQVELPDGTIRGGFTLHAMFAIHRRDVGKVPRHLADQEARYLDR